MFGRLRSDPALYLGGPSTRFPFRSPLTSVTSGCESCSHHTALVSPRQTCLLVYAECGMFAEPCPKRQLSFSILRHHRIIRRLHQPNLESNTKNKNRLWLAVISSRKNALQLLEYGKIADGDYRLISDRLFRRLLTHNLNGRVYNIAEYATSSMIWVQCFVSLYVFKPLK